LLRAVGLGETPNAPFALDQPSVVGDLAEFSDSISVIAEVYSGETERALED
jgi:hypothetical protein